MSIAMHGPNGEYEAADSEEREQELREAGYVDGHEHFSKQNAELEVEKQAEEASPKPKKSRKKAAEAEPEAEPEAEA